MGGDRWSATPCVEDNYYICQHHMPYVSKKNREKVWNRWNSTFGANELANEVEVVLSDDEILRYWPCSFLFMQFCYFAICFACRFKEKKTFFPD